MTPVGPWPDIVEERHPWWVVGSEVETIGISPTKTWVPGDESAAAAATSWEVNDSFFSVDNEVCL